MDITKKKHIVTSGCSYGMMANSISNVMCSAEGLEQISKKLCNDDYKIPFYISKGDVIIWDFSLRSQSSEWIADTIERSITFLLEKGVAPDDIYAFCEWTSWDRISVDKFDWLNMDDSDLEIEDESNNYGISFPSYLKNDGIFPNHDYNSYMKEWFTEINIGSSNGNIGRIGNRFYLTPTHTHPDDLKTINSKEWHSKAKEYELQVPTEVKISNYLNNIIRTQNFLKNNSIKYNFIFMQQSLSGWFRNNSILCDFTHNFKYRFQNLSDGQLFTNPGFNPTADKSTNIEEVYEPAKIKINQIDFDNIWFYKNDKYERGGIDEWAIDTFGMGCMLDDFQVKRILRKESVEPQELMTNFGYHPNIELYKLLWNTVSTNCNFFKINQLFKERLTEIIYEDLNHNGISKNGVLISRKELLRIYPGIQSPVENLI